MDDLDTEALMERVDSMEEPELDALTRRIRRILDRGTEGDGGLARPHKAIVAPVRHKGLDLGEPERTRGAAALARSEAELKAIEDLGEEQLAQNRRARTNLERKG